MAGVDTPESLAADMLLAASGAVAATRVVVQESSHAIKERAKQNVLQSAPAHNAGAHQAITYDTTVKAGVVEGEIGYDKNKRGGSLGNLLEYGGGGDKSPAHRDVGRAFDAELPEFEETLAQVAGRLL